MEFRTDSLGLSSGVLCPLVPAFALYMRTHAVCLRVSESLTCLWVVILSLLFDSLKRRYADWMELEGSGGGILLKTTDDLRRAFGNMLL